MGYDVVVCTRNRSEALSMSLPRLLDQTVPPDQLIVVDSSDDPDPVEAAVAAAKTTSHVPVQVVRSPPGLPAQRNVGLQHVSAPVVFFPDDDSLYARDFAEHIMRVYDQDSDGVVGAITGEAVPRLPEGWAPQAPYEMGRSHRIHQLISDPRQKIEHRLIPDPLVLVARAKTAQLPGWASDAGAVPDSWVGGFRMTFRTEAIRRVGFDTTLRDYAAHEDLDAGFTVAATHAAARVPAAKVFHYQHPGGRGDGRTRGATNVANRAYVVCKHAPPGSLPRRRLRRYAYYRSLLYALGGVRSKHYRDACAGAIAVARNMQVIESAAADNLQDAYRRLLALAGVNPG